MTLTMMVMMICSTIISQTSNSSSSGSRSARTKTKTFLESNGQNVFRPVEKKIKLFGHSRAPKKCHILTIFPTLGKLTHMKSMFICPPNTPKARKKCQTLTLSMRLVSQWQQSWQQFIVAIYLEGQLQISKRCAQISTKKCPWYALTMSEICERYA